MLKKEIIIFCALFVFLALGMHFNQWFSHPIEHFRALLEHSMPYHPFLYTALLYVVVAFFRWIASLIVRIFKR